MPVRKLFETASTSPAINCAFDLMTLAFSTESSGHSIFTFSPSSSFCDLLELEIMDFPSANNWVTAKQHSSESLCTKIVMALLKLTFTTKECVNSNYSNIFPHTWTPSEWMVSSLPVVLWTTSVLANPDRIVVNLQKLAHIKKSNGSSPNFTFQLMLAVNVFMCIFSYSSSASINTKLFGTDYFLLQYHLQELRHAIQTW